MLPVSFMLGFQLLHVFEPKGSEFFRPAVVYSIRIDIDSHLEVLVLTSEKLSFLCLGGVSSCYGMRLMGVCVCLLLCLVLLL